MQAEWQPEYPLLYSLQGFLYSDLLLAPAERAASARAPAVPTPSDPVVLSTVADVRQRAEQTLGWVIQGRLGLLSIALNHLTLARAALYESLLASRPEADTARRAAREQVAAAVDGLRSAASMDHIPRGLLTRAWLRHLDGDIAGARADLDEAWEIAERGPMPLFQADILLYRARLFRDRDALEKARALIDRHGYHRRDEELRDAEAALK
jgi:hypothetical protein